MTGTTMHRNGIEGNKMVTNRFRSYMKMPSVLSRVRASETFEQVLSLKLGYNVEYYGKYHAPRDYAYGRKSQQTTRVMDNNDYDFRSGNPMFDPKLGFKRIYQRAVDFLLMRDGVDVRYAPGQQKNGYTGQPYTPIRIDSRYG